MDIGSKIAELRKAKGISQQSLADYLFVSRDLVSKWENGSRRPDYSTIEKIALFFHVSADLILEKKDAVIEELSDCVPSNIDLSEESLTFLIEDFLNRINRNESIAFINRYYYLKSISDIANLFNVKENHIRSLLSRARKKLKSYLKENIKK